ncbi:hypothetical protein [Synechococcus sp. CS-1332]|uniref:hypothetical protein n=1 Tax=Synechococcus sp. CS-1332 TaxID=2847972 RepID=UPI00223B5982|nr:hypothetical protein [Synechococcus sp. CS-1332]MCT0208399.1 hypothetical protein [Synechococcus sp. CS-1332]
MDGTASSNRSLLKLVVALTPLAGTILFPLVVPILMLRVSIASGVIAAVVIGTLWFAAMLRTSEMPGHH